MQSLIPPQVLLAFGINRCLDFWCGAAFTYQGEMLQASVLRLCVLCDNIDLGIIAKMLIPVFIDNPQPLVQVGAVLATGAGQIESEPIHGTPKKLHSAKFF